MANTFDWNKFKEYVNTYDPEKHGLSNDVTIIKDMIYGLGIAIDDDRYGAAAGYVRFLKYLEAAVIYKNLLDGITEKMLMDKGITKMTLITEAGLQPMLSVYHTDGPYNYRGTDEIVKFVESIKE